MEAPRATEASRMTVIPAKPEPLEVDLRKTAVVVIDMQNAFVSKGGFFDRSGVDVGPSRRIIDPIKEVCAAARTGQARVIYVVFRYSPDLREMGNPGLPSWYKEARFCRERPEWRDKFLIRGTWGAEIVKELRPAKGDIVVEKLRYSAFFGTGLDVTLKTLDIKYLAFMGVATNICVEASLRDAYYHGYFPILIPDATAPLGSARARDATVSNVIQCYGWVTKQRDFVERLGSNKSASRGMRRKGR
jgi:ureidoacrylate peracid hydrolase